MKLRKNIIPRCLWDFSSCLFIILILPVGYWFEVFLVLPSLYSVSSFWYIIHVIISTFLLTNIASNYVYMVLMDTSIQGEVMLSMPSSPGWKLCVICESITPPRSWHCNICNICILKRDHHCQFSGCCIGHKNHRYFFYFLIYLSTACIYILYFNTYFILQYIKFNYFSFLKVLFPLAILLLGIDNSAEHCYTAFYVLNIVGVMSTLLLLYYHGSIVLKGLVMYESSHNMYDYSCDSVRENILQVFGDKWYLTWVSPFIKSELPCDGINWIKCNSKVK